MTLFTLPLTNIVIALARSVRNDIGNQQPQPVYFKAMLNAMRDSHLLVHERPLLILRINDRPISQHSPDFIVQDQDTLIVNLLAAPSITQADVNCVQACLDAHSRAAGGALINFGGQRLAWMNIIQNKYKYYSRNRSIV